MSNLPTSAKAADILARVRQQRPRIHCLMNTVVQKFTADGITAVGGVPSMTSSQEEIESFVAKTDALTINLGTLDAGRREVIRQAVTIAGRTGKPWIVDPVHCDYSPSRLDFAHELMTLGPSIMRGNATEMAVIGDVGGAVRIQTGPVDRLSDATRRIRVLNGHSLMAKVTGTGCLSGGVIAAFMAVEPDAMLAAMAALVVTGISAEIAAKNARGPGTFEAAFLDALFTIDSSDITAMARIENDDH